MTNLAKYLLAVLALIVGIGIGYNIGHYFGKSDGLVIQQSKTAVAAVTENTKATKQREVIDDQTRKMPDAALINDMRSNGWLRD